MWLGETFARIHFHSMPNAPRPDKRTKLERQLCSCGQACGLADLTATASSPKRSQTVLQKLCTLRSHAPIKMLHSGAGRSCPPSCTYSEQSHQIPGYASSLPKPQQLRGCRLRSGSIPEQHLRSVRSRRRFTARAEAQGTPSAPWKRADARLVLADGSVWRGKAFGATDTEIGEVVFNTSITGYEEIMTDPSYRGQFVVFTHPHIGNVGINTGDSLVKCKRVFSGGKCRTYIVLHQ